MGAECQGKCQWRAIIGILSPHPPTRPSPSASLPSTLTQHRRARPEDCLPAGTCCPPSPFSIEAISLLFCEYPSHIKSRQILSGEHLKDTTRTTIPSSSLIGLLLIFIYLGFYILRFLLFLNLRLQQAMTSKTPHPRRRWQFRLLKRPSGFLLFVYSIKSHEMTGVLFLGARGGV